jgi:hypothetical protein
MNKEPLVTVNILSYNRKFELHHTLTKVYEQDYKKIEVILVDNASKDGSAEMVETQFPFVKLIRLKQNVGIEAWNNGMKIAKGEYVLVLDDDAYPEKDSIVKAVNYFEHDVKTACITFNIINTATSKYYDGSWMPADKTKLVRWPVFVGCAFMVKVKRLPEKFIFPCDYFIYQHELPMGAEIYISGKEILFIPDVIAYHNFNVETSYTNFRDVHTLKNNLLFITKYLSLPLAILYYFQNIIYYLTRSIRHKWFKEYFKTICRIKFWIKRKPVPLKYFLMLRPIYSFNKPLWSKSLK